MQLLQWLENGTTVASAQASSKLQARTRSILSCLQQPIVVERNSQFWRVLNIDWNTVGDSVWCTACCLIRWQSRLALRSESNVMMQFILVWIKVVNEVWQYDMTKYDEMHWYIMVYISVHIYMILYTVHIISRCIVWLSSNHSEGESLRRVQPQLVSFFRSWSECRGRRGHKWS